MNRPVDIIAAHLRTRDGDDVAYSIAWARDILEQLHNEGWHLVKARWEEGHNNEMGAERYRGSIFLDDEFLSNERHLGTELIEAVEDPRPYRMWERARVSRDLAETLGTRLGLPGLTDRTVE